MKWIKKNKYIEQCFNYSLTQKQNKFSIQSNRTYSEETMINNFDLTHFFDNFVAYFILDEKQLCITRKGKKIFKKFFQNKLGKNYWH